MPETVISISDIGLEYLGFDFWHTFEASSITLSFLSVIFDSTEEQRCLRLSGQDEEKADLNCEFSILALSIASEKVLPIHFKGGMITLSFLRLEIKDQNFYLRNV